MGKFEKIDENFAIQSKLSRTDIKVYDVREKPFKVYGLIKPENDTDGFLRMPDAVAKTVSEKVYELNTNTAGGRVRFCTDSDYIAIHTVQTNFMNAATMPLAGSAGFDIYVTENGKQKYLKTFVPPPTLKDGYVSEFATKSTEMREYTINFPSYSNVLSLKIILSENAKVTEASDYGHKDPIVYYGSSITQGACSSRPGNSYENMIHRRINYDYLNLGFSGNARAELEIANYIAGLPMSAFVYDYDHNAPTLQHYEETHERMFNIVREAHPDIPIICVSRPFGESEVCEKRREVIIKTVENAKKRGDKNVYFINGAVFAEVLGAGDSMVVDGCHPTDLGFASMAKVIGDKLIEVLS